MNRQLLYCDEKQSYIKFYRDTLGFGIDLCTDKELAFNFWNLAIIKYLFLKYAENKYKVKFRFKNFIWLDVGK